MCWHNVLVHIKVQTVPVRIRLIDSTLSPRLKPLFVSGSHRDVIYYASTSLHSDTVPAILDKSDETMSIDDSGLKHPPVWIQAFEARQRNQNTDAFV